MEIILVSICYCSGIIINLGILISWHDRSADRAFEFLPDGEKIVLVWKTIFWPILAPIYFLFYIGKLIAKFTQWID